MFIPDIIREIHGGYQELYRFPNGFGASVVNHKYSYGLELAVIKWDNQTGDFTLRYDTPITGDVLRYIDEDELYSVLERIYELCEEE